MFKLSDLLQGNSFLRAPEGDPSAGGGGNPSDTPTGDISPTDLPPLIGEDLSFADGYQDRIGEHAEGSTFKNLADVFKSNKEGQRTITALNQEKADLTKRLEEGGASKPPELPADAAAYKEALKLPDMPEGVQLEEAVLDRAIGYALEKGYGPEALADFLAFDIERAGMEAEAAKNTAHEAIGKAKGVIVEAVGEQNYETAISDAKFVKDTLGLPLESEDLVNQPNMVVALSKLKTALSEGTLKGASLGGVQITSGGKLSQADAIVSDPKNDLYAAFHDNSHALHEQAVQTHARLITESAS